MDYKLSSEDKNPPQKGHPQRVHSLQSIIDAIPVPIFYKDLRGYYLGCNSAFERFAGMSKEKIIGRTVHDILPAKAADSQHMKEVELLAKGGFHSYESRIPFADTTIHDVVIHRETFTDSNGKIIGLAGAIFDITERKRLEEQFEERCAELDIRVMVRTAELAKANEDLVKKIDEYRRSEEELKKILFGYQTIVESQIALICRCLADGRITYANPAWCALFSQDEQSISSKNIRDCLPAEEQDSIVEQINALTEREALLVKECRLKDGSGTLRWYRWEIQALFTKKGRLQEYLCIGHDITELRNHTESLRDGKRFYEQIFSSIQHGILIVDKKMRLIATNQTIQQRFGGGSGIIGRKCFEALHAFKAPCKHCPVVRTLETQDVGHSLLLFNPGKSEGKPVWFEAYSFPLRDAETGALEGAVEFLNDVTSRKKVEKHLHAYQENLRGQIQEWEEQARVLKKENRQYRSRALTDQATGLYNRSYITRRVEDELSRARRFSVPLTVIILEAEHIAAVSEVYGPEYAGKILRQYAQLIKKTVRKYDVPGFWDEKRFVIISWGLGRQGALQMAERLSGLLNNFTFGTKKQQVKLSSHIAVTVYPDDKAQRGIDLIDSAESILSRRKADRQIQVHTTARPGERGILQLQEPESLRELRNKIEHLNESSHKKTASLINSFARDMSSKDCYSSDEIAQSLGRAVAVGKFLGLSREKLILLREAMLLHDIGKIGIPYKILLKKKNLTPRELELVHKHPQIGADIIRSIPGLRNLASCVFYHHERWDGKGYLTGAREEQIPLDARIIGLLDVYQALTNRRPYRAAYPEQKALQIIKSGAGNRFDPRVVCAFLEVMHSSMES